MAQPQKRETQNRIPIPNFAPAALISYCPQPDGVWNLEFGAFELRKSFSYNLRRPPSCPIVEGTLYGASGPVSAFCILPSAFPQVPSLAGDTRTQNAGGGKIPHRKPGGVSFMMKHEAPQLDRAFRFSSGCDIFAVRMLAAIQQQLRTRRFGRSRQQLDQW